MPPNSLPFRAIELRGRVHCISVKRFPATRAGADADASMQEWSLRFSVAPVALWPVKRHCTRNARPPFADRPRAAALRNAIGFIGSFRAYKRGYAQPASPTTGEVRCQPDGAARCKAPILVEVVPVSTHRALLASLPSSELACMAVGVGFCVVGVWAFAPERHIELCTSDTLHQPAFSAGKRIINAASFKRTCSKRNQCWGHVAARCMAIPVIKVRAVPT